MSTTDLPGSSLLAGRYRLVERLGAGGMSVVWRGFDEVLGRQVAVKVLPPSTSTDPSFRRRLRAEAQAAARLSHPHITNVYDYGEATTVDGEPVPYVVMELVDGESLAAVLARSRRLPWPAAVRISSEVAAALAAAHARGIVHRDVAPANVMLTSAGAKVVDFGISALIGENDIDPDGSLLGTPAYLAPERLEGGRVSPATDVYAVGLLIYRMLTGELPWDVGTTTALLRAHQYTEPEPLPPVEGLPPAVEALIARCLEKRPDDRPSSAEVAQALAAATPAGAGFLPERAGSVDDTFILASPQTDDLAKFRAAAAARSATPQEPVAPEQPADPSQPAGPGRAGGPPPADPQSSRGPAPQPDYGPAPQPGHGSAPQPDRAPAPQSARRSAPQSARGPASLPVGAAAQAGAIPPPRDQVPPPPDQPAPVRHRPRPSSGRSRSRRVLLVAGAVAVAGIGAYGFSMAGAGDPSDAALPSVVAPTGKCVISYTVWADDGAKFKASVSVANRDTTPISNWKLWFVMPGDQDMSGNGKVQLTQQNGAVTVTAKKELLPQATQQMEITGRYDESNAAPKVFQLDGKTCETYVSGKPGAPSQPVQHLSDGTTQLGPVPTSSVPVPGLSTKPNGVVVPVPIPTVSTTPTATPTTTGVKTLPPSELPTTLAPSKAPDPPPSNATLIPGDRTTPPSSDPVSEDPPPSELPAPTEE